MAWSFAQRAPGRMARTGETAVQHAGLTPGSATQNQARHHGVAQLNATLAGGVGSGTAGCGVRLS